MPAAARVEKLVHPSHSRQPIPKNRLRYLRERHKAAKGLWLTTAEVATLTGITESIVSRHETHERGLTEAHVLAYSKLYKVRPDQLFANLTISK